MNLENSFVILITLIIIIVFKIKFHLRIYGIFKLFVFLKMWKYNLSK